MTLREGGPCPGPRIGGCHPQPPHTLLRVRDGVTSSIIIWQGKIITQLITQVSCPSKHWLAHPPSLLRT